MDLHQQTCITLAKYYGGSAHYDYHKLFAARVAAYAEKGVPINWGIRVSKFWTLVTSGKRARTVTDGGPYPSSVPSQLKCDVDLNSNLQLLWSAAINPRTRVTYATGFQRYLRFMLQFNLFSTFNNPNGMPPVSEPNLQYFITYCFGTLKLQHDTVKTYLAGIRFSYLQAGIHSLFDETHSGSLNRLQALLRGYKRLMTPNNKTRLPITYSILCNIVRKLRLGVFSPSTDLVLECMCIVAFLDFSGVVKLPVIRSTQIITCVCKM
ncbi:uncharacterized protein [Haliotis asinina]|uniref:uncharacterized protein n=1 Tax=Haliotis asinina TaxID=109174 RepID=UPI00353224F5